MKNNKTLMIANAGLIAALYVVLTYVAASVGLASTQPTVSPGTAAAVNTGRIVSASEIRTWITPLASPTEAAT